MKKVIGIVLAALLLTAGIAAATDFTLSGSYYSRGQYYDNVTGLYDDSEAYGNFDHELSIDATWQIDDSTKVFARFEIRDETWGTNGNEELDTDAAGSNVYAEQVWGSHKFAATDGTLSVGLMSAGAWGTSFFDAGYDGYRVKYVQPTAMGTLIGVYQKAAEGGNQFNSDDDLTDVDAPKLTVGKKQGQRPEEETMSKAEKIQQNEDYKVADIALAQWGRRELDMSR